MKLKQILELKIEKGLIEDYSISIENGSYKIIVKLFTKNGKEYTSYGDLKTNGSFQYIIGLLTGITFGNWMLDSDNTDLSLLTGKLIIEIEGLEK